MEALLEPPRSFASPDGDGVTVPAPGPSSSRGIVGLAMLIVVVPVLVAGVRAAVTGWYPSGDDSYAAIGARDVFTRHPPLLGYWASASRYTHIQLNHPGPLLYDLLAVPVRLLGVGPGVAIGMAFLNSLALVTVIWLARRVGGTTMALLAAAFLATLTFAIGSVLLFDPWTQFAPILPFAVVLTATWAAMCGDEVGLPIAVVAGSFVLETHLSYVLLVPVLVVAGLVGHVVVARADGRRDPASRPGRRRRVVRSVGVAIVLALVCWVQPLADQAAHDPGNLRQLASAAQEPPPATPTLRTSLVVMGGTVALPPFWLPPAFGKPTFHANGSGRPLPLDVASVAVLLLVLGWLAWRARQRGDRVVMAGVVTVVLSIGAGFATVLKMPLRPALVASYLRWLWPLSMFVWLVVVAAVLRGWRARSARPEWARPASFATVAVVLGFSVVGLHPVDNGTASPTWASRSGEKLSPVVLAAVRGRGRILVLPSPTQAGGTVLPVLLSEMQTHGVPFLVNDQALIHQLGGWRSYNGSNATTALLVTSPRAVALAPPGFHVIGTVAGLTPAEAVELTQVTTRLERRLVALGGFPTTPAIRAIPAVDQARFRSWSAQVATSPHLAIRSLWLLAMESYGRFIGRPILDLGRLGATDLRRYVELAGRQEHDTAVLIGPAAGRQASYWRATSPG